MKGDRQDPQWQRYRQVVFEVRAEHQGERGSGGVKGLKTGTSERAAIDNGRANQHAEVGGGVNAAMPDTATERIKILRVLADQHGLGLAVAELLFEIGADGRAAIVPDESRGAEADLIASLLQAPAEIDVVSGPAEDGIEAADFSQSPFVEGHIAAGDVLGLAIGKHHMGGATGRNHYRCGD